MHCHGWRSVYCMPKRPAFKGSTPINLSDRLHQVLRWALGSVEIFFSRHCPIWEVHCPRGRINFSLLLSTILKLSSSYILGIHKHRSNSCISTEPLGTTTQKAKDVLKS
ncbi:hypothetical protein AAZX31_13G315400 [Glycine max]